MMVDAYMLFVAAHIVTHALCNKRPHTTCGIYIDTWAALAVAAVDTDKQSGLECSNAQYSILQ
jgi:hypothetical protein